MAKKKRRDQKKPDIQLGNNKPPNYLTRQPAFSCPLSPGVPWFHGLRYISCPLVEEERDMEECSSCPCRASNTDELILLRKKKDQEDRKKRKKRKSGKSRKTGSEPVVTKKGESYVSP